MKDLTFSVITVSYNHSEFIRQTIESVLMQRYDNFEHIIIDGGSTDKTLEILEAYPHLKWVSEPDRGQSHALNKGFRMATGDVIAWINSDDWYPPGTFQHVNIALQEYPIVIGRSEVCDRYGTRKQDFLNPARNWFDILKYWVFESVPSQPSIFFRRELLDDIEKINGEILDESLEYCMDYEFWLRLTKKFPLKKRVDRVFSYIRDYDTNKTGEHMDVTYREMEDVYKRHTAKLVNRAHEYSFVYPLKEVTDGAKQSVESIVSQAGELDLEILFVDYAASRTESQAVKKLRNEMAIAHPDVGFRYKRTDARDHIQALYDGALFANAVTIIPFQSGLEINENFAKALTSGFQNDNIGAHVFLEENKTLAELLLKEHQGGYVFRPEGVFLMPHLLLPIAISKVALLELCEFYSWNEQVSPMCFMRELLLGLHYKGWAVSFTQATCFYNYHPVYKNEYELLEVCKNFVNSSCLKKLGDDFSADNFAKLRAHHGFSIVFPGNLISAAETVCSWAPESWDDLARLDNPHELKELVVTHPDFSPGWYFLCQHSKAIGRNEEAEKYYQRYMQQRDKEAAL